MLRLRENNIVKPIALHRKFKYGSENKNLTKACLPLREKLMRIPLTMLEEGQEGVVVAITPRARSPSLEAGSWRSFSRRFRWGWRRREAAWGAVKRLADLGILTGTRIKVVRKAPFGGPIEIEVGGSRFMIGRRLAERILVEVKPVGSQPNLG